MVRLTLSRPRETEEVAGDPLEDKHMEPNGAAQEGRASGGAEGGGSDADEDLEQSDGGEGSEDIPEEVPEEVPEDVAEEESAGEDIYDVPACDYNSDEQWDPRDKVHQQSSEYKAQFGDLVYATMRPDPAWPGMIFDPRLADPKTSRGMKPGKQHLVRFFGPKVDFGVLQRKVLKPYDSVDVKTLDQPRDKKKREELRLALEEAAMCAKKSKEQRLAFIRSHARNKTSVPLRKPKASTPKAKQAPSEGKAKAKATPAKRPIKKVKLKMPELDQDAPSEASSVEEHTLKDGDASGAEDAEEDSEEAGPESAEESEADPPTDAEDDEDFVKVKPGAKRKRSAEAKTPRKKGVSFGEGVTSTAKKRPRRETEEFGDIPNKKQRAVKFVVDFLGKLPKVDYAAKGGRERPPRALGDQPADGKAPKAHGKKRPREAAAPERAKGGVVLNKKQLQAEEEERARQQRKRRLEEAKKTGQPAWKVNRDAAERPKDGARKDRDRVNEGTRPSRPSDKPKDRIGEKRLREAPATGQAAGAGSNVTPTERMERLVGRLKESSASETFDRAMVLKVLRRLDQFPEAENSIQLIKDTNAAQTVVDLRGHSDQEIALAAKALRDKWKRTLRKEPEDNQERARAPVAKEPMAPPKTPLKKMDPPPPTPKGKVPPPGVKPAPSATPSKNPAIPTPSRPAAASVKATVQPPKVDTVRRIVQEAVAAARPAEKPEADRTKPVPVPSAAKPAPHLNGTPAKPAQPAVKAGARPEQQKGVSVWPGIMQEGRRRALTLLSMKFGKDDAAQARCRSLEAQLYEDHAEDNPEVEGEMDLGPAYRKSLREVVFGPQHV